MYHVTYASPWSVHSVPLDGERGLADFSFTHDLHNRKVSFPL